MSDTGDHEETTEPYWSRPSGVDGPGEVEGFTYEELLQLLCDCEYPHRSDYDPYNFERCTCPASCYHLLDLPDTDAVGLE